MPQVVDELMQMFNRTVAEARCFSNSKFQRQTELVHLMMVLQPKSRLEQPGTMM